MDFLRMDCRNVTSFFKRRDAQPAAARSLFDYIIDTDLKEEDQEGHLKVRRVKRTMLEWMDWSIHFTGALVV